MFNSFIIYEILVRFMRRILQTRPKNHGKIFFSFAILLLSFHYLIYIQNKERNHFEKMEVSRVFNSTELKRSYRQVQIKYHPDKIKEKTENAEQIYIELREIHEVISKPELKEIYDKFGSKNDKMTQSNSAEDKTQTYLILALAEGALIYGVYFIFSIILTYDDNVSASRKWLILLIICSVGIELYYYFVKITQEDDILDYFLPDLAIFERIEIIRFSIGPLANIIRCAYRTFFKLPFDLVLDQNEKIMILQQEINYIISSNKTPYKEEVLPKLKEIENLSFQISQNIEKEIKKRENENKIGWFKKILKFGVILLMLYGVAVNLFGLNQEKQEL